MKTAVSVPDPLFRAADALARRLGVSRSRLYSVALSEYLARRDHSLVTDRLNAVYGETDGAVDHAPLILSTRSLPSDEW